MSRLEVPLKYRTLQATGDTVVWADLTLRLKDNQGAWKQVHFRVDSGTQMMTMLAVDARKLELPIPKSPVSGLVLCGQEVRPGLFRARIVGMDSTEFVFPCYFIGDPNAPSPPQPRNLLGLTGVIDQIRLTFDGTTSALAPWGILVVEKR
jgi:hypothetical protein